MKSKSRYDWQSVGQFVLVSWPSWSRWPDVTFICVTITFYFSCRAPSLTRGRVCNLQCNAASSISSYIVPDGLSASSSWCRTHNQILISLFSPCRAPSPISPMNKVMSKSHYDRQSVGQSVMVSGAHLGPATNFSFSLRFSFRRYCLLFYSALSDERTGL
jgi:hypothetical protein